MTRRVCLDRPPDGARIDGVHSLTWREPPEPGELVRVQVYRKRWWLARVCEVAEEGTYSVEVVRDGDASSG